MRLNLRNRASTLRARLRPAFSTGAMWTAGLAGALGVVAPALPLGTPWPPLRLRCMAVTALSLAVALAQARRVLDPAALRLPLLALSGWLLTAAGLTGMGGAAGSPWLAIPAAGGLAALALAPAEGDTPAPAQHRDRHWTTFAGLALLLALPLMITPRAMTAHWPWRLDAPLVAQYASMFGAWGLAAWLLARERRRYVRQPVLWGLLVWAAGVLLSSLWHVAAFRLHSPSAWLWFATLAATAALAAQRLRPATLHWRARRTGPWPHDAGTSRLGH